MHPVLRQFSKLSFALAVLLFSSAISSAQSPPRRPIVNVNSKSGSAPALDPTSEELFAMGPDGEVIEQAREQVLALLSETNTCSRWYLAGDPDAVDRFRSLRYDIDLDGASAIRRLSSWHDDPSYYQPYVARTGQNVGRGSTITLNAHGAFFKNSAPVQVVEQLSGGGYFVSFRTLRVGSYTGATLQARILSLLHELGHVLNMLPLDAGIPSGPQLSVHNTQQVLRYCGQQIDADVKSIRSMRSSGRLSTFHIQPAFILTKRFSHTDPAP